jgi:hypothetical protein
MTNIVNYSCFVLVVMVSIRYTIFKYKTKWNKFDIVQKISGHSRFFVQIPTEIFHVYFIRSISDKSLRKLKCDFII